MKRTFDCVEMQHKGAESINKRLEGMSKEQIISYWEMRGLEFKKRIDSVQKKIKAA